MIKEFKFENHEEWLSIRRKYIGGSDAGAVIGMNPYKSAYALWAEKTGKIPEFEGNLTTETGSYLEEFVAKLFEKETGKKVRRKNRTIVNDVYPFACANVDRLVIGEKAILEIKTTNSLPLMHKLKNSTEFPEAYLCQCTHYLAVTGLEKVYLAVLMNCREFKIYELERDESEINALMQAERIFWDYVKTNTEPPVDGTESTSEVISTLYPESNGFSIDLSAYNDYLEQYIALGSQIEEIKKNREEMANKVKIFMAESEKGESADYKVSWASSERSVFDTKSFIKDYPDIDLSDYYKKTLVRSFKVKSKI